MEEIIQAVAFEAMAHRAQAKLQDIGGWHERQAERLEAAAALLREAVQNSGHFGRPDRLDTLGQRDGKTAPETAPDQNGTNETAPVRPERIPKRTPASGVQEGEHGEIVPAQGRGR